MNPLNRILSRLLDVILPKDPGVVALETLALEGNLCLLSKASDLPRSYMKSLFQYKDPRVRTLVWQIKYAGNRKLTCAVATLLSEEIISFFEEKSGFTSKNWLLVPIPASKKHLKEKGFNQTDRIARAIIETDAHAFVKYAPNLLVKIRETDAQVTIKNRTERLLNLKNTYETRGKETLTGTNVFIIDDVITTGSTMLEARRALISAGAKEVICLAIAH
jgi:ComF family protein